MNENNFIKIGHKIGYKLGISKVEDEIIDEETGEVEIIIFYYINFINSFLVLDFAPYTGSVDSSTFEDFYKDACNKINNSKHIIPTKFQVKEVINYYLYTPEPKNKDVLNILKT